MAERLLRSAEQGPTRTILMDLLFNDRSITKQAPHPYAADDLLLELAKLLIELEPRLINNDDETIEQSDAIYKHGNSRVQQICEGLTVERWLFDDRYYKDGSRRRELAAAKQYLISKLTANPYIETLLAEIDHLCIYNLGEDHHDMTNTIIAGAALLNGILFSVPGCALFPPGTITVSYWPFDSEPQDIEIGHYTTAQEVRDQRRRYDPSGKHDVTMPTYGRQGTKMELSKDEAEDILNAGVLIGKRVFGRGNDGQIYVFPSHRPNLYHGYPVEVPELRKQAGYIYSRLRERGWIA